VSIDFSKKEYLVHIFLFHVCGPHAYINHCESVIMSVVWQVRRTLS